MSKRTVWGYGRVSPSKEGTSIERQWDIFNAWWNSETRRFTYPDEKYQCDTKKNWYFDAYVSGVDTECHERKGVQQILRQMKKGDVFVVALLDRLSRCSRDILTFISALRSSEIRFAALDLNMDTETPEGYFAVTIFAAMSQFEADRKRERREAGIRKLEQAGCWVRGHAPFGWKKYKTTCPELGKRQVWKLEVDKKSRMLGDTVQHLRDKWNMSFDDIAKSIKSDYAELIPVSLLRKGLLPKNGAHNLKAKYATILTRKTVEVWYKAAKAGYPQHGAKRKKKKNKKEKERTSFTTQLVNGGEHHVPLSPALSVPLAFSDS